MRSAPGIADDKAIYSYMPDIIDFYLGEKPLLKNVPTWRCREPEALAYVLDASARTRRQGSQRLGRLRHADRPAGEPGDRSRFSPSKLEADPDNFIAQPTLALSTCPTCVRRAASRRAMSICGPSCSRAATASASCRAA